MAHFDFVLKLKKITNRTIQLLLLMYLMLIKSFGWSDDEEQDACVCFHSFVLCVCEVCEVAFTAHLCLQYFSI